MTEPGDVSHVTTEQLAERLHQLGFVIAPHGDHIGLRGSLFTSVRVKVEHGTLVVAPRFGPLARTQATVMKTLGLTLGAVVTLSRGPSLDAGLVVVLLALVLWAYDALRYTLTESCIGQVRQAFNALLADTHVNAAAPDARLAALGAPPVVPDPAAFSAPKAEVRR